MTLTGVSHQELTTKAQEIINTTRIRASLVDGCIILRGGSRVLRNKLACKLVNIFNETYNCMDALDQFFNIPHADHVRIMTPESD